MAYQPRTWVDAVLDDDGNVVSGDVLTAADLNRIEQGIAEAGVTESVEAVRGPGASAGTVTLTMTGHVVTAVLTGLVLTGTSEVVAVVPDGWGPAHKAGHGYVEDTQNGWWPTRATTSQVQVMGPAPAGTTVEGSISWSI